MASLANGIYRLLASWWYNGADGSPLAVSGASTAAGATLSVFDVPSGNSDRFVVETADGTSTIRNIGSGKYVAAPAAPVADDDAFQQTATYGWVIEQVEATTGYPNVVTVDGVECMVCNVCPEVAPTLKLNANGPGDGIVCLKSDSQGFFSYPLYSRWIFAPSTAFMAGLPVASGGGWGRAVGADDWGESQPAQATLYPTWLVPESIGSGSNVMWQYATKRRYQDNETSSWLPWSARGAWTNAALTMDGNRAWLTGGIPATYDGTSYKAMQVMLYVRATTTVDGIDYAGEEYAVALTVANTPVVTLSNAGFGPSGLYFDYSVDYTFGATDISVNSIKLGDKELVNHSFVESTRDGSGSMLVPPYYLNAWIDNGDELMFSYQSGNDVTRNIDVTDDVQTATLTVSYDAGSGMTFEPAATVGEGRVLVIDLSAYGGERGVWLDFGDGITECQKNDDGTWSVMYPFGSTFDLYAAAYDAQQEHWGVWHETLGPSHALFSGHRPCHAWNWDGGSFLLELTDAPSTTRRTVDAEYETVILDSREYESVLFSKTLKSSYDADGILKRGITESDKEALMSLVKARHVTYRAPHGDIADVAITGISYEEQHDYTTVRVSMVQETV